MGDDDASPTLVEGGAGRSYQAVAAHWSGVRKGEPFTLTVNTGQNKTVEFRMRRDASSGIGVSAENDWAWSPKSSHGDSERHARNSAESKAGEKTRTRKLAELAGRKVSSQQQSTMSTFFGKKPAASAPAEPASSAASTSAETRAPAPMMPPSDGATAAAPPHTTTPAAPS
eukprot:6505726-Prymnesium_polylepis.1